MKPQYRVRNWSEYNAGLKQRGSLTFCLGERSLAPQSDAGSHHWIESAVLANWEVQEKSGKPGASVTYSNQAIVTMVSLKRVFKLPGRALCGFVESIFQLMQVDLSMPGHTTISRWLQRLEVTLPVVPTDGKRHAVGDSTKVKVCGEGAYDRCYCYDYIEARGAIAGIPPQRNAKIWVHFTGCALTGLSKLPEIVLEIVLIVLSGLTLIEQRQHRLS